MAMALTDKISHRMLDVLGQQHILLVCGDRESKETGQMSNDAADEDMLWRIGEMECMKGSSHG